MRLYPLEPTGKLAINISTFSRRLRLRVMAGYLYEEELKGLIIVTDGTPDDYVVALLSHHLNGEEAYAIAKPRRTRLEALHLIPNYLSRLRGLSKIAVLMDQERDSLEAIYEGVGKILIGCEEDFVKDRLCLYKCLRGKRRFDVILIINGLSDVMSERHTIEDHLLQAANRFLDVDISDVVDSKDFWWKRLRDIHDEVYNRLRTAGREEISRIFPQQFEGLKFLKREMK